MAIHTLIRATGPLWDEATRSPFLDALAAGNLPADALHRWLAQDYLFAKDLLAFQAILLAKAPRNCHQPLIEGLAALNSELRWFESHATRLKVDLDLPPHATCRRYTDFLIRCAYTRPYAVLVAMLFGVEASYLAAWSALAPAGPYAEFIERWSSAEFGAYVAALGALADQHPHEEAQHISTKYSSMSERFGGCHWRAERCMTYYGGQTYPCRNPAWPIRSCRVLAKGH